MKEEGAKINVPVKQNRCVSNPFVFDELVRG